jgi:hypothetical protein
VDRNICDSCYMHVAANRRRKSKPYHGDHSHSETGCAGPFSQRVGRGLLNAMNNG